MIAQDPRDEDNWLPEETIWDEHILEVETIQRDENKNLTAFIRWKNGRRTKVGMDKVYIHCPVPMLRFYEDHLSVISLDHGHGKSSFSFVHLTNTPVTVNSRFNWFEGAKMKEFYRFSIPDYAADSICRDVYCSVQRWHEREREREKGGNFQIQK